MALRRAHGDSGPRKTTTGYWAIDVELDRGEDGKRKRKRLYGKTQAEVLNKKRTFEIEQGLAPDTEKLKVSELLDRWLQSSAKTKNREHTIESSYEPIIRLHLKPALGSKRARGLTGTHVQNMINAKKETFEPRTVRNIHAVLRKALNWAKGKKLVTENVAIGCDLPPATKPIYRTLDKSEAQRFLDALVGHRLEALFWMAVLMGLREAELIGLPVAALDLDRGIMTVGVQIQRVGGTFQVTDTKSGTRTVLSLPTILVPMLRAHIERLNEERTWDRWKDQGLLFPNERGGPFHASYVWRQFKKALAAAGLPTKGIRFHDLRHTCASLMISNGVHLSVIKERMRHSQISITADTYGHVFEETQRAAAEQLGDMFTAPEPTLLELPRRKQKQPK
jgi:integrase